MRGALVQIADLQEVNAEMRKQNEELALQNELLRKQLSEMEEKMKLVVVTNTLLYKEDKQETIKQINDWVREIDKCINLLTVK